MAAAACVCKSERERENRASESSEMHYSACRASEECNMYIKGAVACKQGRKEGRIA